MKKFITLYFMLATVVATYAQGIPDPLNEDASKAIGFIQNVGQIINTANEPMPEIYYHSLHTMPINYYFSNKASFVYPKFDKDTLNNDTFARLDMTWIADGYGNEAVPTTFDESDEKVNYYLAHCSSGCDQLSKFKGLLYQDIYDGIDLRVYSNNDWIKMYFVIKPGANPDHVRLFFEGQDNLNVSAELLTITIGGNNFSLPSGIAYEYSASGIPSLLGWTPQFNLNGNGVVEIAGGAYTPGYTLVYEINGPTKSGSDMKNIDWSTYYGGNGADEFYDVDVDDVGAPHATGWSNSSNFPVTPGTYPYKGNADIIVVKFKEDLSVGWSTYYGGTDDDGYNAYSKFGISLDNKNNVFISAITCSTDIPLLDANTGSTADFFDNENSAENPDRNSDQILARFNTNGQLTWGTYCGGNEPWSISPQNGDIVVDKATNDIYMAAFDAEPPLKDIGKYFEGTRATGDDAGFYIIKFNSDLEKQWCSYLGDVPANPWISSLEVDRLSRLLVTGSAGQRVSTDFPKTTLSGAYNHEFGGGVLDNFIVRFNTDLSINWATYIGNTNDDFGHTIITTSNDKIIVLGKTYYGSGTSSFPIYSTTVTNVFNQPTFGGQGYDFGDATICTFDFDGLNENFTYLGGSDGESLCYAVSGSKSGNIFLGGSSNSINFPIPTTANLSNNLYVGPTFTGGSPNNFEKDAMIFGLNEDFVAKWSTVFGTRGIDNFWASVCYNNFVYYVGSTYGDGFPTVHSGNAYHSSTSMGDKEALILRADMTSTPLNINNSITKAKSTLKVYPNPANNKLNLSFATSFKEITIFDLVGSVVKKININKKTAYWEEDILNLKSGIYIVEIIDINDLKVSSKFIKE